jgi:hypothetical protein
MRMVRAMCLDAAIVLQIGHESKIFEHLSANFRQKCRGHRHEKWQGAIERSPMLVVRRVAVEPVGDVPACGIRVWNEIEPPLQRAEFDARAAA